MEPAVKGEGQKNGFDKWFEWPLAPHHGSNPVKVKGDVSLLLLM
jgi:hypothetical protein